MLKVTLHSSINDKSNNNNNNYPPKNYTCMYAYVFTSQNRLLHPYILLYARLAQTGACQVALCG